MFKLNYLLLLFLFIVGCAEPTSEQQIQQGIEEESLIKEVSTLVAKTNTWEKFWTTFQEATANQDKDAIKQLTAFGENWTEKEFDEYFAIYFSAEIYELIANTTASNIPSSSMTNLSNATDLKELVLHESEIEDGVKYESAIMLYFGKVDNRYALVRVLMAG